MMSSSLCFFTSQYDDIHGCLEQLHVRQFGLTMNADPHSSLGSRSEGRREHCQSQSALIRATFLPFMEDVARFAGKRNRAT